MHLEDFLPFLEFREIDMDLTVEPSGSHQGLVEDVSTVRRCEDDDSAVGVESVHLGEELVEGVLPLVVG